MTPSPGIEGQTDSSASAVRNVMRNSGRNGTRSGQSQVGRDGQLQHHALRESEVNDLGGYRVDFSGVWSQTLVKAILYSSFSHLQSIFLLACCLDISSRSVLWASP